MTHPAITAAAQALAAAQAHHDKAREELGRAEAERRKITDRREALEAGRSAIVARRRGGETDPEDGPRLALIAADLEGLQAMLPDATGIVAAAQKPANDALQAVQSAQYHLQRVEQEVTEATLVEHAGKLDGLLLDTLRQIGELHAPLGRGNPAWAPSPALWSELRRLAAAAGRL